MTIVSFVYDCYHQLLSSSTLFWPFIISSLLIATCIFVIEFSGKKKNLRIFLTWLFPKSIYSHPSSRLDTQFVLINTVVYGLFFSSWLVSVTAFSSGVAQELENLIGTQQTIPDGYLWPSMAMTLALFVTLDFAFFLSHYLQHKVSILWRFHRVHHSAEVLNPLTAFRQHPFDQLFEGVIVGLATGLVGGVFQYYFYGLADVISLVGINLISFGFFLVGVHLRHSHIRFRFPNWLSHIFMSPLQHQVHHSCLSHHQDKNFGGVLSIWDVLFRSIYLPQRNENMQFGVSENAGKSISNIIDLYFLPFNYRYNPAENNKKK